MKPAVVQVNKDRLDDWVKKGAQMSDSVRTLVARHLTPAPVAAAPVSATADTVVMTRPAAAEAASAPKTEQS